MPRQPPPLDLFRQPLPDEGVRWELPRRPWGAAKFLPWVFIIAGLIIAIAFGITSLPNFNQSSSAHSTIFDIVWFIGEALASIAGLALIFGGLFMLLGRTTVTLMPAELSTTDRFGPFHWTRRISTTCITGFEISIGTISTNNGPEKPTEHVTCLIAKTDLPARRHRHDKEQNKDNATHDFYLAWAYPKHWMQTLANAIKDTHIVPHIENIETTITIEYGSEFNQGDGPVEKPTHTQIALSRQPDGLTIDVPPTGWLRGTKGIGTFALLWNGFILLMILFIVGTTVFPGSSNNTSGTDPLIFLLLLLPFIAVGIGMGAYAAHLGKSSSKLVVVGNGPDSVIAFHRISPVRKPLELTWPTAELSHLRVDASNMTVNEQAVMELQIHPKQGKKKGLLASLDDEVLVWIAYELRQQTGLPSRAIQHEKPT